MPNYLSILSVYEIVYAIIDFIIQSLYSSAKPICILAYALTIMLSL